MNKKGFTLVELLVVIALISILVIIAVPSVISVTKKINQRVYNSKIEEILASAELYGTNNPDLFNGRTEARVYIYELINKGYLTVDSKKDEDVCMADGVNYRTDRGCIVNPVEKISMNSNFVVIKKGAVGVTATFGGKIQNVTSGELVKQLCTKFNNRDLIGKFSTGASSYCGCKIEGGDVTGIYVMNLVDDKYIINTDAPVKACLVAGDDVDNYLQYDGVMWRVMGLYNVYNDGSRLVAKIITNDNVDVQ